MTLDSFFAQHKKLTRSLKKFVLDYEKELSSDVFAAFLENLSEELRLASEELSKFPAGPLRARKLHELVETEIAQTRLGCHPKKELTQNLFKGFAVFGIENKPFWWNMLNHVFPRGLDHGFCERLSVQVFQ